MSYTRNKIINRSFKYFVSLYNLIIKKRKIKENTLHFHSMGAAEKEMSHKELNALLAEVERMNGEIQPIGWYKGTEGMSDDEDIALKVKLFHLLAWVRFLLDNKIIKNKQIEVPWCLNKKLFNTKLRDVCNAVIHKDKDHVMKFPALSEEGRRNMNVYFIETDRGCKAYFEVGCLIETLKKTGG